MNHCIKCGNNIPEDVETCEEAGFGDGCGKTLRNMDTNTKEGVREEFKKKDWKHWSSRISEFVRIPDSSRDLIADFWLTKIDEILDSQKKALLEKLEGEKANDEKCDCDGNIYNGCPHRAREKALTKAKQIVEDTLK